MARVIRAVHGDTFTTLMEQLQEGYVAAVAATAGCSVNWLTRDTFGRDALIVKHWEDDPEETHLYVQLKNTTTEPAGPTASNFSFQFKTAKHATLLAQSATNRAPSVLVVMISHPHQNEWSVGDHDELRVRHCCYWRSIASTDIKPGVSAPSVSIDRAQVFDAEGLLDIMDRIRSGKGL